MAAILEIDSAIHGAIRMSVPDRLLLGRALSSDLVLGDASIADHHLCFTTAGGLAVEAVDHSVIFGDGLVLKAGDKRVIRQSCSLMAGAVSMRVTIDAAMTVPTKTGRGAIVAGIFVMGFIGLVPLTTTGHGSNTELPAMAPMSAPKIEQTTIGAREAILNELHRRNLDAVQLVTLPEGSYRASGAIAPSQMVDWHAAKQWADETYGGTVLLVDNVSLTAEAPVLAVQSAWVGEGPYVIDGAGDKLFVGAVLSNGWVIKDIQAGRILLQNHGHDMAVRF